MPNPKESIMMPKLAPFLKDSKYGSFALTVIESTHKENNSIINLYSDLFIQRTEEATIQLVFWGGMMFLLAVIIVKINKNISCEMGN